MLHRRILSDDAQGLAGYPLNDTDIVSPVTRLLLGSAQDTCMKKRGRLFFILQFVDALEMKRQAYFLNYPSTIYFASATQDMQSWSKYNTFYTPCGIF